MLWYPFIMGLGLGIGATAFVAANWEDIVVGFEAMKENHQNRRRRGPMQMEESNGNDSTNKSYNFLAGGLDIDSSDESESDDEQGGSGKSTAVRDASSVRQRNGNSRPSDSELLLFEMPSTANSSSGSSAMFLRPIDKPKAKSSPESQPEAGQYCSERSVTPLPGPSQPSKQNSTKSSSRNAVEDSGTEALLSTDDWTDTGKDVWSS